MGKQESEQKPKHVIETRPGHHMAAVGLALCGFALAYMILCSDFFQQNNQEASSSKSFSSRGEECSSVCQVRKSQRLEHFDGCDLLDRRDVQKQLRDAKDHLIKNVKADFGDYYFDKLFVNENDGSFIPMTPVGNQSFALLKRKLMIKVLTAQKELQLIESNVNGCNCNKVGEKDSSGNRKRELLPYVNDELFRSYGGTDDDVTNYNTIGRNSNADAALIESSFAKYVWATGGHSAAAGHGNLYNETYTAYMERDLKQVFGSIGISFEGRNYAMGGTPSAAEIAMCWEEIFGRDVDFFSWDYGMTDAGNNWRLFHYAYRGMISQGRPAFYAHLKPNDEQLQSLAALGLATFFGDLDLEKKRKEWIPDTLTLKAKEIEELPPYLQWFKCNGRLEAGDCQDDHKYSSQCPLRYGKAPWHPGFKLNALWGHSFALYLTQALVMAVDELVQYESESLDTLLQRLQQQESDHFDMVTRTNPVTEHNRNRFKNEMGYNFDGLPNPVPDLDFYSLFLTGKSICHTVRLPSQMRYRGLLTESNKIGGPAVYGQEKYDVGIDYEEAKAMIDDKGDTKPLQLVYDSSNGAYHQECPFVIAPDPKDFLFTKHGDGWREMIVPNDSTRKAYSYDASAMKGIVIFVNHVCDWGNCPEGMLVSKDLVEKNWDIKINDVPVTNLTDVANGAIVASHATGMMFPEGPSGEYRVAIHVNKPETYTKISSIIVF